jgi:hypothetical protein
MAATPPALTVSLAALRTTCPNPSPEERRFTMHHNLPLATTLLATTANNTKHFHIGPWIIVPILIVAAIIAVPVYIVRDRRQRRELESEWPKTGRR